MGMKSTIQNLVHQAITKSLGDLTSTIVVRQVKTTGYDPSTGQVTRTVTNYTVRGVLTGIRQDETGDMEMVKDGKKALIPTVELAGVEVDALDDLVIADGIEYQLKSVKMDPAGAVYTFMLAGRQGVKFDGIY